jgi:hypothetical protein
MLTITGKMRKDVHQLSTSLKLKAGEQVYLTFPSNQPFKIGKWFARPVNGWSDGIERSDQDSLLLEPGDAIPDKQSIDEIKYLNMYLYDWL